MFLKLETCFNKDYAAMKHIFGLTLKHRFFPGR